MPLFLGFQLFIGKGIIVKDNGFGPVHGAVHAKSQKKAETQFAAFVSKKKGVHSAGFKKRFPDKSGIAFRIHRMHKGCIAKIIMSGFHIARIICFGQHLSAQANNRIRFKSFYDGSGVIVWNRSVVVQKGHIRAAGKMHADIPPFGKNKISRTLNMKDGEFTEFFLYRFIAAVIHNNDFKLRIGLILQRLQTLDKQLFSGIGYDNYGQARLFRSAVIRNRKRLIIYRCPVSMHH